jgi:hypothetical protein
MVTLKQTNGESDDNSMNLYKASLVPLTMPSVWKHEHLRMVLRGEPKLK